MALIHPHTHSRETIHQALLQHPLITTAFCVICQRVVLCHSSQLDKAELSCVHQQKARAGQMNLYIAKQVELGPVYINKMVINISGNHLPRRHHLKVEESHRCLKQQKKPSAPNASCVQNTNEEKQCTGTVSKHPFIPSHFYQPRHKQQSLPGVSDHLKKKKKKRKTYHVKDAFYISPGQRR